MPRTGYISSLSHFHLPNQRMCSLNALSPLWVHFRSLLYTCNKLSIDLLAKFQNIYSITLLCILDILDIVDYVFPLESLSSPTYRFFPLTCSFYFLSLPLFSCMTSQTEISTLSFSDPVFEEILLYKHGNNYIFIYIPSDS